MSFRELWDTLAPIGRDQRTGGYHRLPWTPADERLRAWFTGQARDRGLDIEQDGNGNVIAWWGGRGPDAVLTGSHLDSVTDGGAYDGPLGVISGLTAIDLLRARGLRPSRPVGVAVFTEEEGTRFGTSCLGSRLLTGGIEPDTARGLTDPSGTTLAAAMAGAGADPGAIGADEELLGRVSCFIELHVEQGRGLADLDVAVGLAEQIWPHGRWRLEFGGQQDHAGTTPLADRRDPMLAFAATVLAVREEAARCGALATVGKVVVDPGATNVIARGATAWLDARAPDEATLTELVAAIGERAARAGAEQRAEVRLRRESFSAHVAFDAGLRGRLAGALAQRGIRAATLPTGAGHDAGVLSARLPCAMLFVRNPTGISHAPAEYAAPADCQAGVQALAAVLEDVAT
jgi:N-carbamoyl-L-amino-acid hydrolase